MTPRLRAATLPIAVAIGSLAAATLAVALLQDTLGVPNPSAVYLVAVVATALVAGTSGAIAAAIASFLLYNFLFTEPRYTLAMDEPGVWLSVILLLFVGVVVGQLVAMQRARAETASAREREARALFRVSRALATRNSTEAVLGGIAADLTVETGMSEVLIGLGANDASERVIASSAGDSEAREPATRGLVNQLRRMPGDEPAQWARIHQPSTRSVARPETDIYRVLIDTGGDRVGSIWATRWRDVGPPSMAQTRLLAAAADQLGQVIVHDRLVAESRAAEVARESDALKSALLQSVSHDLRTPLATILTATATLRRSDDEQARSESAQAIEREVEYLNRLVTNLLDLSRIEAGVLRAQTDVFELDDLLIGSLERLKPSLDGRPLDVSLPALHVRVDPIFLDAVFSNLIDNAVRHAPGGTPVRVSARPTADDLVTLTVEDGGDGVPDSDLPHLFEKFYRVSESRPASRGGTGIGLAVVLGLVEAMGGRVGARHSDLGGLAIDIALPAASVPAELIASTT